MLSSRASSAPSPSPAAIKSPPPPSPSDPINPTTTTPIPIPAVVSSKNLVMAKAAASNRRTNAAMAARTNAAAAASRRFWMVAALLSLAFNLTVLMLAFNYNFYCNHSSINNNNNNLNGDASNHSFCPVSADDQKAIAAEEMDTATAARPPVTPDSVINLDHGDPTMFEAFWKRVGDRATVVIPGWQSISYFSDASNLCWFMEPEFAREVRRLHRLVDNAVVDGYHIVVGTGSTQLFQAALFALSPSDAHEPMSVVSAAPYYSSYPTVTDYLRSGLFRWAGDANSFKGGSYIELVCTPSNPDGAIREAVLTSEAGKTIHDLAYYWPQYTPMTGPAGYDIMLFTVSKSTGHAGMRLGWALVKDRDVARKMAKFVELNTIGVSKDSQLRAAKVLKAVSDGYEPEFVKDKQQQLFHFGRRLLVQRWERLREAVAASGIFSLPKASSGFCYFTKEVATTNPAFAWLRCEKEGIEDCESFLRSHKILTRSGVHFGADPTYVRVSMIDRDETFQLFIERLSLLS